MKLKPSNPLFRHLFHTASMNSAVVVTLLGIAAIHSSSAQSISVNFGANQSTSSVTSASKTAGAIPVAGNRWNNTTTNGSGSLASLIDNAGQVSGASINWTAQNTWQSGSAGSTATSENGLLTKGYLDDSGSGWTVSMISPFLLNDIYVIHSTDQVSPATMSAVSVNGRFYTGNGAGGTIQVPGSGYSWSAANFSTADTLVESDNYIKALSQPGVSLAGLNSSPGRSAIAGLQVVNAYGGTLAYWDANGTAAGSGDSGGTWGSDTFWSSTADGTGTPGAWVNGRAAVFSAGSDGTGSHVVNIAGTQNADAVWVKNGEITLTGGSLNLAGGTALLRGDDPDNNLVGLVLESDVSAGDISVAGAVQFGSAGNNITGVVTTLGNATVAADQSWNQIAGAGKIEVLYPSELTVGASNLDSTFAGNFTGNGDVIKAGSGNLILSQGSTGASGYLNINSGTVTFSNSAGAYNAGIRLLGTGDLVYSGTGTSDPTITVTGDNSGFSGPVAINGARVLVDNANDLGSGNVTVASGGQLWAGGGTVNNPVFLNGIGTLEGVNNLGAARLEGGAFLAGPVTLQSNSRITVWTNGTAGTISGTLSGPFNLEKTGSGNLIIESTANTGFTGNVVSNAGILRIADQTSLGSTPAGVVADSITLTNGGRLQGGTSAAGLDLTLDANRGILLGSGNGGFHPWTGFAMTVNGAVTGPGTLTKSDGGTLVQNGAVNIDGGFTGNSGIATFNGNLALGSTFTVNSGIITNLNCPTMSIGGAGVEGMKLYVGTTNINIGTGTTADLEAGNASGNAHTINQTGGNLTVTNDLRIGHWGAETSVYNISGGSVNQPDTVTDTGSEGQANLFLGIDGSGILNISGSGVVNTSSLIVNGRNDGSNLGQDALNLTGGRLNLGKWGMRTHGTTYAVNLGGGTLGASANWSSTLNMTVTGTNGSTIVNTLDSVNGSNARTITLSGVLSGAGGFTKQGTGTLVLGNANNAFTGTTRVEGGTLFVRNNSASPIGTLQLAGGILNPGSDSVSAAVQAVSTEFSGGTAQFRIGTGVDRVNTTNLNVTAPTTVAVSPIGQLTVGTEYPVITYTGTATGLGNLSLTPLPNPRYQTSLVHNSGAKSINVKLDGIDSLVWTGENSNVWDGTVQNWRLASNNNLTEFLPLDNVAFNGAAPGTVNLTGSLAAGLVSVNSTANYTFSGAGGLSGNASIVKSGTGTLTLSSANTHLGGNAVNGGTLIAGAANGLGGPGNVTQIGASATLDLNGQDLESTGQVIKSAGVLTNSSATVAAITSLELTGNTTVNTANAITVGAYNGASGSLNLGSSTLIKQGAGQLILNGVSVTTGNITINGGSIRLMRTYNNNQRAVSLTSPGTLTINSGASLITSRWSPTFTVTMPIVLNGGTIASDWPGPNGATIGSPINVTADSTFNFTGGYENVTFSGVISGTGKITRSGSAADKVLILTGTNTTSGGFLNSSGILQVGSGGTTGSLGTGPVTNNATLTFNRSNNITALNNIGGTGVLVKSGAGNLTLTGLNTYTGNTTINTGAIELADGATLQFKPGANGVSNKVTGSGALLANGDIVLDLSTADPTSGNSWLLVDVNALSFESFGSTFNVTDGTHTFTKSGGVHTLVDGAKTWTFDESTGTLSLVVVASGYDSWAAQIPNAADRDRTDDPDSDGFTNLQEYLFGSNPNLSDGSLVSMTSSGGNLVLNWLQLETGSTYTLKESTLLSVGSWTTSAFVPVLGSQTGVPTDYDRWTVTIPLSTGRKFFRVEGVEN